MAFQNSKKKPSLVDLVLGKHKYDGTKRFCPFLSQRVYEFEQMHACCKHQNNWFCAFLWLCPLAAYVFWAVFSEYGEQSSYVWCYILNEVFWSVSFPPIFFSPSSVYTVFSLPFHSLSLRAPLQPFQIVSQKIGLANISPSRLHDLHEKWLFLSMLRCGLKFKLFII